MAEFPTEMRGCSPGSWSHDGTMFVTASNDGKLVVTRVQGNSATTTTLAGMYGTLAENGPPVFSADDRWLGFSTADGAYVSARTNGSLGPPVGGGAPVSTPFSWPLIRFSPDATRLATGEPSSTGRSAYATVVDLTKPAPITTQLSFLRARAGSSVVDLAWSAHSTELALSIQEGTFPAPTNLYLLLGPDVGNGASQNLTLFDSCTGYMCLQVTAFQFQP